MPRYIAGQSGNPGGRPKGRSLASRLRAALAKAEGDGRDRGDVLAESLIALAIAGDVRAIEIVFNRVDGRVADATPEIDADVSPRRIQVAFTDDRWDDGEPPAFNLDDYDLN